jgi:cytoskeletal protein CcmA (bactofilin family)
MFNTKPGLFPKSADTHAARTLRPGSGTPVASGGSSPTTGTPCRTVAATRHCRRNRHLHRTVSRLIVGPEVKLKGAEILDCDTLVVEGRVEATMDSRVLKIAEKGAYKGTVGIDIAEIHGHFEGELTARQQLVIHATGRVSGKIRYGKILIEEGGRPLPAHPGPVRPARRPSRRPARHTDSPPPPAAPGGHAPARATRHSRCAAHRALRDRANTPAS